MSGVPKLGYIYLSEGVHLSLEMKGKIMFVHISVNIILKYHYMLIGNYISFIFLSLFVIKNLGVHADLSKC